MELSIESHNAYLWPVTDNQVHFLPGTLKSSNGIHMWVARHGMFNASRFSSEYEPAQTSQSPESCKISLLSCLKGGQLADST